MAGGGASVIYSDTICDLGGASELANYGEYSGAPSEVRGLAHVVDDLVLVLELELVVEGANVRVREDAAGPDDGGGAAARREGPHHRRLHRQLHQRRRHLQGLSLLVETSRL